MKYSIPFFLIFSLFFLPNDAREHKTLEQDTYMLLLNMNNHHELPRNFRKTCDAIDCSNEISLNTAGMNDLYTSGSGQFSENSFRTLVQEIPHSNFLVIDLREESHGFINGHALYWYSNYNLGNFGKTENQIRQEELQLLQNALKEGSIGFYKDDENYLYRMDVETISNEENIVYEAGKQYVRIPVTDHRRPTDSTVDEFISLVKQIDEGTWLHFHCSAGVGRTTTFMVMYDMLRNARQVSFEDILLRQELIGGKDFWSLPERDHWKYDTMIERIEFLQAFYRFCHENEDPNLSWSDWKKITL